VPALVGRAFSGLRRPYHHMRGTGTNFVIAPGAAICFDRAGCGNRSHQVLVAVVPGFDLTSNRQRP
jgi:hypothetical protein